MRTHLDLFSGIGGFALAARWNGLETIAFSEIDPYACKVLEKNFPGVPNLGDITTADFTTYRGRIDLLTGGFPCQPFSLAGKLRGKDDDRYLWTAMCNVISTVRPTFCLCENVPGIIEMELEHVLLDLEGIDYVCQPLVIPACAVGAGHRRDRVWIVAHLGCECVKSQRHNSEREPNQRGTPAGQFERCCEPTSDFGVERFETRSEIEGNGSSMVEIFGGHSGAPEVDGGLLRTIHGLPAELDRRARIKCLGNAIVPQVAAEIIRCMREAEK